MKTISALVIALALAAPAAAQTIAGDRFTLNTGPCTIRSGSGAPEGVQTGKVCDIYIRTDGTGAAIIYVKDTGTAATGWQTITPGIPQDPTPGKVLVSGSPVSWTATPALHGITSLPGDGLTINPNRDLILSPGQNLGLFSAGVIVTNAGGRAIYPQKNYDTTLGIINSKYLALHAAELWVETLVAQQTMATIGGRVLVAPTNILARDVAPGDSVIYVKYPSFLLHTPGIELGSKLFLESGGKFEAMTIGSTVTPGPEADGSYAYGVFRDQDGSGANQWYAGDAVLDTGKQTGGAESGMIDLYAARGLLSGAGPAIVGSVRTGGAYSDLSPRFALGNLNGLFGHSGDVYGFAAGSMGGAYVYTDPANGLVMGGPGGVRVQITPAGSALFVGDGGGVTNIDGGNIRADTITGDKIAANTITVADLNATGFGDNLIKNGTFEVPPGKALTDPAGLAGWSKDLSSSGVPIANECCGNVGPGTLKLDPGNGAYMSAVYLAQPVDQGETYRIAFYTYSAGTTVGMHVLMYQSTSAGSVRWVRNPGTAGIAGPDVAAEDYTFLAINAGVSSGWTRHEYIYTVPAGVRWVSLGLYDLSGSVSGSVYTPIYYDDVTMTRQIGPGSIKANAITAEKIAAGAITADKIAAGAITADKLTVGTGGNVLRNSECRTSTAEWYLEGDAGSPVFGFNYSSDWALNGEPSVCYYYFQATTPGAGTFMQARSRDYPAMAGAKYEGSVYLGMHRASGLAILLFLNSAGTPLAQYNGNTCAALQNGGVAISNYCRSGVIGLAPAGTTTVRLYVRTLYDGSGFPVTFYVRAMLAEGSTSLADLSPWSPAGLTEINGGLITTGAIQAQHIAASTITGDKIAGRTIVGSHLQIGTIGANEIAARAITADRIAVGALTSTEIAGRSISADRIVAGAITGTEIAGGSITADKLSVGSLSAISATLGSVTAGTITGSTIAGSTIYAGSGNEIQLTNSGMYFSGGNGSNPAKIDMDRGVIWGNNATLRFDGTDFTFNGNVHANNYDTNGTVTATNIVGQLLYSYGQVSGDGIYSRNMPTWGGGVRQVWYNYSEQRFGFWTGAATARSNVQAWAPVDPLAILRAPLVTYASGRERELGFSVEGLAAILPEAVVRDDAGRPDTVRPEAVIAALLRALVELERRVKVLEAKGGGE